MKYYDISTIVNSTTTSHTAMIRLYHAQLIQNIDQQTKAIFTFFLLNVRVNKDGMILMDLGKEKCFTLIVTYVSGQSTVALHTTVTGGFHL